LDFTVFDCGKITRDRNSIIITARRGVGIINSIAIAVKSDIVCLNCEACSRAANVGS
jgi:hypothetical protein